MLSYTESLHNWVCKNQKGGGQFAIGFVWMFKVITESEQFFLSLSGIFLVL